MLRVSDVSASYGPIQALRDVSLEVSEGQIVALLGANGAGKSSTLKVISGILRPSGGSVEFLGQPIHRRSPESIVSLGISHVPEGRELFTELTVEENLMLGAYLRGRRRTGSQSSEEPPSSFRFVPFLSLRLALWLIRSIIGAASDFRALAAEARWDKTIQEDIDRVFGYFPLLAERQKQPAGSLSGGEQQMLAIGRGLMARPKLLLLDEPSLGLAPTLVQEIFQIVKTINREEGLAVLLVEQNATMALRVSQYGYVLETGRIVLAADAAELRENETVRRSYLGY